MTSDTGRSTESSGLGGGNSAGRVFVIVLVVGALVFGLAVGFRLGSADNRSISVAPTRPPATSIQPTLSPAPTFEPSFPPLPIQPATVDEALRQAYYAAGAGISVCVVYDQPTCSRRDAAIDVEPVYPQTQLLPSDFERLFGAGPIEHPGIGSIIVVEDLGSAYVEGTMYAEESLPFGVNIVSINPDGQGIHFLDFDGLPPGRSVVVVRFLPTDPPPANRPIRWHANVIAFDVTPSHR